MLHLQQLDQGARKGVRTRNSQLPLCRGHTVECFDPKFLDSKILFSTVNMMAVYHIGLLIGKKVTPPSSPPEGMVLWNIFFFWYKDMSLPWCLMIVLIKS